MAPIAPGEPERLAPRAALPPRSDGIGISVAGGPAIFFFYDMIGHEELRAFPESAGFRLPDLLSALAPIRWFEPDAEDLAKKVLSGQLTRARQILIDRAHDEGIDSGRLLRNLAASVRKEDLAACRILAGFMKDDGSGSLRESCAVVATALPRLARESAVMGRLLGGRSGLTPDDLAALFGKNSAALLDRLFAEFSAPFKRRRREIDAGQLVRWLTSVGDDGGFAVRLAWFGALPAGSAQLGRGLDKGQFGRLPPHVRQGLLSAFGSIPTLFERRFREYLAANLGALPDSPTAIGRREACDRGESALREGRFASEDVPVFLRHAEWRRRVLPALRAALTKWGGTSRYGWAVDTADPRRDALLTALSELPSSPEVLAVRMIATPRARRLEALKAIDEAALSRCARLIGAKWAWPAVFAAPPAPRVVARLLRVPAIRRELLGEVVDHYATGDVYEDGVRLSHQAAHGVHARNVLLAQALSMGLVTASLKAQLMRAIRALGGKTLQRYWDPQGLTALATTGAGGRAIASTYLGRFREAAPKAWVSAALPEIADKLPQVALDVCGKQTSEGEIGVLLSSAAAQHTLRMLEREEERNARNAWSRYLTALRRGRITAPENLAGVLSTFPALAREFCATAPGVIPELDARFLDIEQALYVALANRPARKLLLPRLREESSDQREWLGWVQRRWVSMPRVKAAYELAVLLGLRYVDFLVKLSRALPRRPEKARLGCTFDGLYRTYPLPKRSGGTRTITVPEPRLKGLQRAIHKHALQALPIHAAATGFRPGVSITDNAAAHVGRRLVVNVDIDEFFPSTRYGLVRAALSRTLPELSREAQRLLAELCCYKGALPIGAPTSPTLANLVMIPVDTALARAAPRMEVTYTRYADDLTLSGDDRALKLIPLVKTLLAQRGYQLDDRKTNLFRKGRRQIVTGLVVNEKPNMPRRLRRRLRAAVHNRMTTGEPAQWHGKPISDTQLRGHLAFLMQTQPEEARRYLAKLKKTAA